MTALTTIEGRKVKFYYPNPNDIPLNNPSEDKYETGTMHQWFLVSGSIVVPYALIERENGTMVFVNYRDVIFEKYEEMDLNDLFVKGVFS